MIDGLSFQKPMLNRLPRSPTTQSKIGENGQRLEIHQSGLGVEKRRFSRMFVQAVDLPNECSPETLLTIPIQEEKQLAACRSIGNP
jgi:hypothetical protein